ncbi:four helix bundle protein [bacterium]|nr:four helix bundle protein [bacterium]
MVEVYELDVYRLAEQLSDMVWHDFDTWLEKVQKTIGYQIVRAVDSIASNIAEGYGRYALNDRKRFYHIARGSFEETKAWLRKAIRRGVISSPARVEEYTKLVNELGPKLNAFIRQTRVGPKER